jgi:hypothetical protein
MRQILSINNNPVLSCHVALTVYGESSIDALHGVHFSLSVSKMSMVRFSFDLISYSILPLGCRFRGKVLIRKGLMMEEKQRWDMKFERLLSRVEKLCEGLAESSLSAKDQAYIWTGSWEFLGGMSHHFEEQYPELKREH